MAGTDDEDDEFPATQPVMSVLLSGKGLSGSSGLPFPYQLLNSL